MNKARSVSFLLLVGGLIASGSQAQERLRDPTRPLSFVAATPTAAGPQLELQAILNRQGKREAIISNQRVGVGDTVQGARVVSISQNGVVYEYRGNQQSLQLRPQIRK